jgi:glycosyltransferase involved in cell wall biosynthesis
MGRVVVAANSSWNIENFRKAIISALVRDGHEVITISADPHGIVVDGAPIAHRRCFMDRSSTNPVKDLGYLYRLIRVLSRDRPDVFLGFTIKPNIYGSTACRLLAIPAIPNVSGLGTAFLANAMLRRVVSGMYRFAFQRAPKIFFQNPDDQQLFLENRLVRQGQGEVLPGSGVNLHRFEPSELPTSLNFLLIARLIGDKGIREFVAAARKLRSKFPNARFSLLGELDYDNRTAIPRDELESWVGEGVVEYLGHTSDVRPFIRESSVVVLPSYREGVPRALLEAAAMGRPLIGTDVPGCKEVVRDGKTGFLCEVRNVDSLAAAMERFANTTYQQRRTMGVNARTMAEEEFDEGLVVDAYLREIRRLAG